MPEQADTASDSVAATPTVTLWREIDALGGTSLAQSDYERGHDAGYDKALEQVLAILTRRGYSEHDDPLVGMTLNRDNLREYLAEANDRERQAQTRLAAQCAKAEAMRRVVQAVVAAASRPPAIWETAVDVPPAKRTAHEAADVALWQQSCLANAVRFVAELATMTDNECDFLDAYGLREVARMLQVPDDEGNRAPTVPRLYSDADRDRAIDVMRRGVIEGAQSGRVVDAVAEALGMRRAGA